MVQFYAAGTDWFIVDGGITGELVWFLPELE